MKINETRPNVETSGNLEEQLFSIQDQGMIFDILRNKMYSNPILAICREISCNARDAHREVGTPDVPVQIYLPNNLEPVFKIKDLGPGISPDRMSNIFIKYTASTKRDDNTQTGGFGLGAKTPFSYSDTFTITTVHNNIKYDYSGIIDETKVGKLVLMSSVPTDEPNGTEIAIPVKPVDFRNFNQWIELATRHWDVKPTFKGGQVTYQIPKKILEGSNWAFANQNDYQASVKLIIDGIEYPLDMVALRNYADTKLLDSTRSTLLLYFGIGELSLSASREQVYLDKPTQAKIKQRIDDVIKEIKKNVEDKIDKFANLWEANVFYRKELMQIFHSLQFLGPLSWKGIKLHSNYVDMACPLYFYTKGTYSRKLGHDPNKITRSISRSLNFDENSVLYLNDLPLKNPTPKHLKKAFENFPDAKSIQLICPSDTVTVADLNKTLNLDKMAPNLLSSIAKASGRKYTPASSRLLIYKFDSVAAGFRQVSYASLDEDTNDKVLAITSKDYQNNRKVILKNKKQLPLSTIRSLSINHPKVSFYGIDEEVPADRIEEEFSDFTSIDDFIEEKVISNSKINYVEMKFALSHNYHIDEKILRTDYKFDSLIDDKKSLFLKRRDLHQKVKDICQSDLGLLEIYEALKGGITETQITKWVKENPEFDFVSINTEYEKKYPLLKHLSSYNFHYIIKEVAQYINLIDKG